MHVLRQLLEEGRLREVREAAAHQLSQHPDDEEALLALAKVALVDDRADQAEELLSRVKSEDTQGEVTLLRAAAAIQRKDFSRAREHYQVLIRQPSPPAEAWHGLGVALLAQGKAAEAREAHEQAVALKPNQSGFRFELGVALAMEKRPRAAVHQFVQGLRLDARDARAYWALAQVLTQQGKVLLARRVLEAGLKQVPQSQLLQGALSAGQDASVDAHATPDVALFHQASMLLARKRGREALKLLREGWEHGTRSLPLKLLEAEACKDLQPPDMPGVFRAYEEAIAFAPDHWEPYTRLGVSLLKEGHRYEPRAIELLETARRLEPSMPETSLNLVLAYVKAQRIPEALALAQQVVEGLAPEHPLHVQATSLLEALRKI
ncbi:tetratricopeptide repeat protein [Stigmatella aurantiaca]|uniref:Tetratricopeptide repeat family n=1 Tax=Stigmatella aurantiaca (strain DW4/3-1) TaxID=378806 RepID=Q09A65_STIAD|nr:tetratricopeptide repeat protein [Stigmatella aurantiaca]ADO75082.1 Tetratricopeptide repeat family protein [Stigmatella aurantiaca DW4/3-1]EAU68633.1 tetratricopeptide repeat family [Stigmatella aurantiaca DW4/3-1]